MYVYTGHMQIRLLYPKLYSLHFQVYSINEGEYGTKPSFEKRNCKKFHLAFLTVIIVLFRISRFFHHRYIVIGKNIASIYSLSTRGFLGIYAPHI